MANKYLKALEYPGVDSINIKDETTFRRIVVWLERNKIKQAGSETVNALSNLKSNEWRKAYEKYRLFLGCPNTLTTDEECLNWLAGYAIHEQYSQKKNVYNKHAVQEDVKPLKNVPNVTTENPLDKLDFQSNEFMEGINKIAKMLYITPHPDPTITLKAVRHIITERFTSVALQNPEKFIVKGTPFPLHDADLGIDLGDPVLKHAAKILRMLYIQDLRNLQTRANELIVKAQNVTANPKTDTKLGKVGF
ncbi:RNA transcription, translation and transport factor protein [Coccinella septempunctata]|uniref:RNA transcription, translation and transport factor protein n=1 Tax=Coccinella septempunctata TaxID=41139 RepID=UPI001D069BBB|nr:RNA transcription, translation and transport factor protein [Coccinella septempunctata]